MTEHKVTVSYEVLVGLCVQGTRIVYPDGSYAECVQGLSPDAQIVNAAPEVHQNAFTLYLIDTTDAPIPIGPLWRMVTP